MSDSGRLAPDGAEQAEDTVRLRGRVEGVTRLSINGTEVAVDDGLTVYRWLLENGYTSADIAI